MKYLKVRGNYKNSKHYIRCEILIICIIDTCNRTVVSRLIKKMKCFANNVLFK